LDVVPEGEVVKVGRVVNELEVRMLDGLALGLRFFERPLICPGAQVVGGQPGDFVGLTLNRAIQVAGVLIAVGHPDLRPVLQHRLAVTVPKELPSEIVFPRVLLRRVNEIGDALAYAHF
jgi:hypothetical protein